MTVLRWRNKDADGPDELGYEEEEDADAKMSADVSSVRLAIDAVPTENENTQNAAKTATRATSELVETKQRFLKNLTVYNSK